MMMSNLLLDFFFKLHCIYLLVKILHVPRRGNSVLVPRLTLGSAIISRLKNENYNISKKKSKEDNKTQQQNTQREMLLFKYKMFLLKLR